jgi:pimeloyl-ACP methyl ester carboxylesterase
MNSVCWAAVLGIVLAGGCSESAGPAAGPVQPPAAVGTAPPQEATMSAKAIQGELVAYKSGVEIGRERFRDDGDRLVSEISLAGMKATVTVARSPRHATVEAAGQKVEREVDDRTVVLENGSWQAYAVAASWFPDAAAPAPVTVLVPGQNARLDGTLQVTPAAGGGRRVKVTIHKLEVTADVDAVGLVTHVEVPAQGIDVRPAGQAAPVVADRPAPAGVAAEPFEASNGAVTLRGELWRPATAAAGKVPVVVFIAGSGPTDRDCNSGLGLRTDAYRKLAEALAGRGVASVRYDKRGVGKSGVAFDPARLTLDDFAADAGKVVEKTRADARLGPVIVAGHSEGGLIALVLAQKAPPDGIVLLATAGRPLAALLREQLARQLDAAGMADLDRILAALRAGGPIDPVPPALQPIFPRAVLGFLRSEMDVDPVPLFHALKVPAAVVQGENDAQVTPADARLLAAARPDAKLTLLPRMNHVLRDEASPRLPQPSYEDPSLPLSPGVVDAFVAAVAAVHR